MNIVIIYERIMYVGYLYSLGVRTGMDKKILVRELAQNLVFFLYSTKV